VDHLCTVGQPRSCTKRWHPERHEARWTYCLAAMRGTGIDSTSSSVKSGGAWIAPTTGVSVVRHYRQRWCGGGKTPESQKPRDEKPPGRAQYARQRSSSPTTAGESRALGGQQSVRSGDLFIRSVSFRRASANVVKVGGAGRSRTTAAPKASGERSSESKRQQRNLSNVPQERAGC